MGGKRVRNSNTISQYSYRPVQAGFLLRDPLYNYSVNPQLQVYILHSTSYSHLLPSIPIRCSNFHELHLHENYRIISLRGMKNLEWYFMKLYRFQVLGGVIR